MSGLHEMMLKSEICTDILKIAFNLEDDPKYSKLDVIADLLQIIDKHELGKISVDT